jgi:hypothetical protein
MPRRSVLETSNIDGILPLGIVAVAEAARKKVSRIVSEARVRAERENPGALIRLRAPEYLTQRG